MFTNQEYSVMDRDALVMIFSGINRLNTQAEANVSGIEQRLVAAREDVLAAQSALALAQENVGVVEAELNDTYEVSRRVEEHRLNLVSHLQAVGVDIDSLNEIVARVERAASSALPRPEPRQATAARPPVRHEPHLQSVHPTAADEEPEAVRHETHRRPEPQYAEAQPVDDVWAQPVQQERDTRPEPARAETRRPAPFASRQAAPRVDTPTRVVAERDAYAEPSRVAAPVLGSAYGDGGLDVVDRAPPIEAQRPVFASGARDALSGFDSPAPASRPFGGGLGGHDGDDEPLHTGRPLVRLGRSTA